jgi:nitrate reductase alpha subunit
VRTDPRQDGAADRVVERDYPNTYKRFTALGPLMEKVGNGGKGISWNTQTEVRQLGELNGKVHTEGSPRACRGSSPTSTPPKSCCSSRRRPTAMSR